MFMYFIDIMLFSLNLQHSPDFAQLFILKVGNMQHKLI